MRADVIQLDDVRVAIDAPGVDVHVTHALPRRFASDCIAIVISGGDPFAAAEKLRDRAGRIPIMIVTPLVDHQTNAKAVDAGARFAVAPPQVGLRLRELANGADAKTLQRIEELSAVFDLAPTGIIASTVQGEWIYVNESACQQLGYRREELRRQWFAATTHPDDRRDTLIRFADLVAGVITISSGEKRYVRKDGSTMWAAVRTNVTKNANGEVDFFVTTIQDITARHAAEEQVRLQARLLACAEEAIVAVDLCGKVLFWNASAERMYGWPAEEAFGRNVGELIRTSLTPDEQIEIDKLVRSGRSWSGDLDLIARDGRRFPGTCTDSPIFDNDGRLIGIVGISRDITDRRRGEHILNRRYSQLQATTDLGRLALRGIPLDELFQFAATCLGVVLDTPLVEISKIEGDQMRLVGGRGWKSDEIGTVTYARECASSEVLQSDEPLTIDRAFPDRGIVSSLAMRVFGGPERTWGLIAAHSNTDYRFDLDDSLFIISIANILGDAIQRRNTELELHARVEQQSAIADLSRFALASVSDHEVIEATCAVVGALLRADHPVYLNYEPAEDALFIAGGRPWLPEKSRPITADGESLAGYVLTNGRPVIVHDYTQETRFNAQRIFVSQGIVSGIAAPVRGSSKALGVLAANTRTRRQFTDADAEFLTAVGNVLAQAMERNAARRDLATSEARHRAVVEGATEVIFSVDVHGIITSLNPAFEALTGWPREEWIGKPVRDLIVVVDRGRFDRVFARLTRGETVTKGELHLRGKDRGILVETNGFVRGSGDSREIYGFARDITAARAAEVERRGLLTELQLVLDSTDEGIYAVDTEGRCTLVNRAAAAILGYTPDELYGANLHQLVHSSRLDGSPYAQEACPMYGVLRSGRACRGSDDVFFTSDGKAIVIDYSASPIVSDGMTRGVVVTFTDVTERRKLEAQLEQAKRLGSLGRLAATVAHEFNNVLMSISPFAEIVRRDTATSRAQNGCEQILKAVRRGKAITEEILRFTQPNDPKLTSFSPKIWLDGFAADAQPIVGSRYVIATQSEPSLPDILADANQLDQAFTNLVVNARDSMPEGGAIEIGARRESKSTVFSFGVVHNAEQFVHFWVRDSGGGMPNEVLRHIFEPLFTTKRNGTGLGLAVTHQVVKRHGGELFVESRVQRGTTFHLFMPIARSEAIPAPAPISLVNAERARFRTVLIVEDEPAVADGIAAVLRLEGTQVTVVGTGAAALEHLSASRPDAVILDVGLPDMDGGKVYEHLLSIAPALPVIFSTGHERSPRSALAPNTAWLMKPYELDVLLGALDTLAAQSVN